MIEDHEELKYAAKVYISLIKSPLYDSQSNHTSDDLLIDIELKNYFARPKQFKLNDIIFIIKSIIKKNYVVYKQDEVRIWNTVRTESQIREKWHWFNFK